ncbi:paraquat-inducible protein A [Gilvimarinus polysaccharolyticus]|uniref:paraquat-inducible protein A n=1 Tax=Gilvimarinus polysaccharolyticus TaxID=863921 RepID=UPI0006734F31|nr:paraquat-inducible protein A [Gilvimarinus polysaccharolyticus]
MRAIDYQICRCSVCAKLVYKRSPGFSVCPRCNTPLHLREPGSISRTWALLITAFVVFIPANLYPIMTVAQLDQKTPSTILAGVINLAAHDMLPIAIVVFIASIAVPLFKLLGIAALLITVHRRKKLNPRQATIMYRVIELIGRWSMLDLFVISILVTLVSFGKLASIEPNIGATAFGAVVVLTLLAAKSFDPRLIWDLQGPEHE